MATSFAAYASQYFTRQQQNAASTMTDSHPMFFSFTTDGEGSSRLAGGGGHSTDLNDLDDPHLGLGDLDHDPYLKLDEDEQVHLGPRHQTHEEEQTSPESPPGWLAHLAASPDLPRRDIIPTRLSSSSSEDDSSPPADLVVGAPAKNPGRQPQRPRPPSPPPQPHSLSLTDSLLPRDGFNRPVDVFSLPDPRHTHRKRRKYHDSIWISIFLGLVSLCVFFCILLLFTTHKPKEIPSIMLPYTVLLRTVPMLVILTVLSALVAYVHVWLLKVFVKPVMIATSVFIPATLFVSAVCAFVGSFMWDGDKEPTWGESVGLRLFAIIPLVLSLITARRLLDLPRQIHTTSSTLTLSTHLLINNPFLLALSPAILVLMLVGSIPFVTLIFRLLLVGYSTQVGQTTKFEWHIKARANWAIFAVACVWFWSWTVARGILRVSCAGVIGAWYFADPSAPPNPPTSTHTIHAALTRSTGPSLGTIVLSSLILTLLRIVSLLALLLRRVPPLLLRIPWVPLSVPIALYLVPGVEWLVIWLERKSGALSRYALVYAGLTGDGFWPSAVRARELVWGVESPRPPTNEPESGQRRTASRNRGQVSQPLLRNKAKFGSESPLALLTISPLTLSFPFALLTYLFVAHTIGAPNEALGAALLAGGVTALVGLFCVGVVRDTAETLYLCYCIDKAEGLKRREEVFIAFEYDFSRQQQRERDQVQPGPIGVQQQAGHAPTQVGALRGNETLFDAEDDVEAGYAGLEPTVGGGTRTGATKKGALPLPVPQQRLQPGKRGQQRNTPLLNSPFSRKDEDEEDEDLFGGAAATPTARTGVVGPNLQQQQQKPQPVVNVQRKESEELLEDDLDPFRRSLVDDEEAQVRTVMRVRTGPVDTPPTTAGGMRTPTSAGGVFGTIAKPTLVNLGGRPSPVAFGHRKTPSGGGGVGVGGIQLQQKPQQQQQQQQRMLTSTQELNMKSQFLMNMKAYGEESERSEDGIEMGGSERSTGKENENESDGEESQLGPGSDFFK